MKNPTSVKRTRKTNAASGVIIDRAWSQTTVAAVTMRKKQITAMAVEMTANNSAAKIEGLSRLLLMTSTIGEEREGEEGAGHNTALNSSRSDQSPFDRGARPRSFLICFWWSCLSHFFVIPTFLVSIFLSASVW